MPIHVTGPVHIVMLLRLGPLDILYMHVADDNTTQCAGIGVTRRITQIRKQL